MRIFKYLLEIIMIAWAGCLIWAVQNSGVYWDHTITWDNLTIAWWGIPWKLGTDLIGGLFDSKLPLSTAFIPATFLIGPWFGLAIWHDFTKHIGLAWLATLAIYGSYLLTGSYWNLYGIVIIMTAGPLAVLIIGTLLFALAVMALSR